MVLPLPLLVLQLWLPLLLHLLAIVADIAAATVATTIPAANSATAVVRGQQLQLFLVLTRLPPPLMPGCYWHLCLPFILITWKEKLAINAKHVTYLVQYKTTAVVVGAMYGTHACHY